MELISPLGIGIDFGGTSVKIGVVRGNEIIEKALPIKTKEYTSAMDMVARMAEEIAGLKVKYPEIKSVGVGMPGFIDNEGVIIDLTNVPGWSGVKLKSVLEQACCLPVGIDNDANCMAYAEWKQGAGRGMHNLVCVTLGTGVGGGIIVDDKMLRGAHGAASEIGQMSIYYRGRKGHWGQHGSLEDYIGNNEFAADAVSAYKTAGIKKTVDDCTPLLLEKYALEGDQIALKLWDEFAEKLACALVNCFYVLDPEAYIIGGAVAKAGKLLFDPLQKHIQSQICKYFAPQIRVLPAMLGSQAGLIGAAQKGLESLV